MTHHISLAAPLLFALVLPMFGQAGGQTTSPADPKLALKAALVLTPEFCATKITKGGGLVTAKETFEIGKAACAELEPALKGVFSSVTRVAAGSPEDAQIVLLPKFVDASTTRPSMVFTAQKMLVLLEWTVKDRFGKTVWLETVEGSAAGHGGGTHNSYLKRLVGEVVKDAAEQSARKMSSSPELRKLTP